MKGDKFDKELYIWAIMAIPFLYLAYLWPSLPETIPIHFDMRGEPDGYGPKSTLIWLTGLLVFLIYIIFAAIPLIDPKKKIQQMGRKFYQFKFIMIAFMSILSIFIIYSAKLGSIKHPNMIIVLIGLLFMVLGNFFPAIKPNYFMGIRTPWTLENEEVWRKTHRLGGIYWMAGGLLIALLPFFLKEQMLFIAFIAMVAILVIVPIVYSYISFKEIEKSDTTV